MADNNDKTSIETLSMSLSDLAHKKPWWFVAAAAVVSFFLGSSGIVWNFLDYKSNARASFRATIDLARQLQADMAAIQRDILNLIPEYHVLRAKRNQSSDDQHAYLFAKARLVKLVSDYNALEARRSFVEQRQPVWFPISGMIRPVPPLIHGAKTVPAGVDGAAEIQFSWENAHDEVLAEVRRNLRKLYESYGQEFPSESPPEVAGTVNK